jgi:hypothetical protein
LTYISTPNEKVPVLRSVRVPEAELDWYGMWKKALFT